MNIKKKRIHNVDKYISHIPENWKLVVAMELQKKHFPFIDSLEFWDENESILPKSSLGKASFYNAEGRVRVRRDLPMEEYILELPYELQDWWGNRNYWVSYIRKWRYPREFIYPFQVYVQMVRRNWKKILVSSSIKKVGGNNEKIKNTINMFLERFGECYIVDENFDFRNYIQVDWEILPIGDYPWEEVREKVFLWIKSGSKARLFSDRLDELSKFNPDFVAKGIHGFLWYVVFWYKDRNYFVCENIKYGNATYVFNENRESLSKLTKGEIMTGESSFRRIIHSQNWKTEIKNLFD